MARKLARVVRIDAITPIRNADRIECAHVGGWTVVVKKGEFVAGDLAIYLEIDSFLPEGNPGWQFLVDKQPTEFNGVRGHVLRSVQLQKQVSQGFLLPLTALGQIDRVELGRDVAEQLGVVKYEPPLPEELAELAIGYRPSLIPETDEERIQNLAEALAEWRAEGAALVWEKSEKLEGNSCSWAQLDDQFLVCSRNVVYREAPDIPHWAVARRHNIEAKLRDRFGNRNIVLQGELVGPGVEGNIYRLKEHEFYLFRVYQVDTGTWMSPEERHKLAEELGIKHAPIIDAAFVLPTNTTMEGLLALADGPSLVNPQKRREGVVFKAKGRRLSFKVVSNKYLLNEKL